VLGKVIKRRELKSYRILNNDEFVEVFEIAVWWANYLWRLKRFSE